MRNTTGITGAQAAWRILDSNGLTHVDVERTQGMLSDHYDPRPRRCASALPSMRGRRWLRSAWRRTRLYHALQDKTGYAPLQLRSAMVPTVQIGSWLGPIIFLAAMFMSLTPLAWAGLILGATAVFALVTLLVEFNASNRAKQLLVSCVSSPRRRWAAWNKVPTPQPRLTPPRRCKPS